MPAPYFPAVKLGDRFKSIGTLGAQPVALPPLPADPVLELDENGDPMHPLKVSPDGKISVEKLAHLANVEPWKFYAAKVAYHWPDGAELSQDDFDQAIEEVANVRISIR